MKLPLWTLIPALLGLTGIYLELGYNGFWNYTLNDFLIGNALVSLGIGLVYISEGIYFKIKKTDGEWKI